MFMKITELVLSLFVSYIGTLELIFTAKYFYHWLHRHHANKSIEEIQEYILSELNDAEFHEEHAEDLELEKEDQILPERLSYDRSGRSSVDRAKSAQKDDIGEEEEMQVNSESNSRLNRRDSMKRSVSPNLTEQLDETNEAENVTGSPNPYKENHDNKPAMQTYHSDVYISKTEISESPQNDIFTTEINISSHDHDAEEDQPPVENYRSEKSPILNRQSSNTIAIVDLNDKKIYEPSEKEGKQDDNHETTTNPQQDNEFFNQRKQEQQDKRKPKDGVESCRRDSTDQINNYCDQNVIMGGVEDTLLSRLSWEEQKSQKSIQTTETTTYWSSQTSYQETTSEVVQRKSAYTVNESSIKTATTDFLNNEKAAEHVKLEGLSDFYDFNASVDYNKSISQRKSRPPPRLQPFAEINTKPLDYEHTLKNLSDFLDYNVKMNRTGMEKAIPNRIYKSASEISTPSDDVIHSEYASRKSSVNVSKPSMTPMNYLSPSPSNYMFFPEDQRDIEYLRRKYQESATHQFTYAGTSADRMHRGTGSSEELSRFQRSRSQSRSMSDILQAEGLELRRSSKRLGTASTVQTPDSMVEDDSSLDHIILSKLEDEEYHHYRRYSLCQECQVEEYPDDDDYICIEKIEVRQLNPYEIQLSFNDTPSEASSVCATPLPEDEVSPQREYSVKSQDEVGGISESISSSKFDSGVDFESSVHYQRTFDGNLSDQFVESNEEESVSSGYSQLGYTNNRKSPILVNYESTDEVNMMDSLMLPDVVADQYHRHNLSKSKSPSRNRSVSPAWGYSKQEDVEDSRWSNSISPNSIKRDILSKEREDGNDDNTYEKIDDNNMTDFLSLPSEVAAEIYAENPTESKSPTGIRSGSPIWSYEKQESLKYNRASPSASPSKLESDILFKEHEDSYSVGLRLSPRLEETKPDEEIVANVVNKSNKKSKRNKKKEKRQQYGAYSNQSSFEDNPESMSKIETPVQNCERKVDSATPSPLRESPNKSLPQNVPSNASSSSSKSATGSSRPNLSDIGRYNSLGNSELIKDASMSPWF